MPNKGHEQSPAHRRAISIARGGNPPSRVGKDTYLSQTTVRKKAGGKKGDGKIAAHPKNKGITVGKPTSQSSVKKISHAAHEKQTKRAKK